MGAPALAPRSAPTRRAPTRRAPTRRAPARRAPARKPAASRRRKPRANGALASRAPRAAAGAGRPGFAQPALAGAALIPHAAVRTAGAVRDLSDSSLIVRLTAGRGWIAVLCALLGGIVALNVVSLSINATSGRVSQAIQEYERQNSSLRGELAEKLSASRVEDSAVALGLAVPAPEDVTYVKAGDGELERLADALGGDTLLTTSAGGDSTYSASPTESSSTSYTEAPSAPSAPATPPPASSPSTAPPAPSGGGSGGGASTGGVGL